MAASAFSEAKLNIFAIIASLPLPVALAIGGAIGLVIWRVAGKRKKRYHSWIQKKKSTN
jgi:hypothetical protein